MSTLFTALEIGKGDAFLLQTPEKNCLFDAGQYSTIIKLLQKKGIDKLHLAICSHNDVDHANGFIELLQDGSIKIDEIWLPGIFASIIQFVKDNHINSEEIEFLAKYKCPNELDYPKDGRVVWMNYSIKDNNQNINESLLLGNGPLTKSTKSLNEDNYQSLQHSLNCLLCYRSYHKSFPKIFRSLERIMKIALLAYKNKCKIRWFEPIAGCANNSIDYGLIALNSKEITQVKRINDLNALAFAIHLSVVNKYSLVFEYWEDNLPIIRFSADSDCVCHSSQYNHIIVTAPHHGSDDNQNVYKALKSNNIIWVRSDCKTKKRPCKEFKKMTNKYCLACSKYRFRKEICLEYNNSSKQWNCRSGTPCKC